MPSWHGGGVTLPFPEFEAPTVAAMPDAARGPALGSSGSADFDQLRTAVQADLALRREMENAFLALTEEINVSDRGSRFIAGTAGEWIIAAACYSAGVIALPEGHNADGFDLAGIRAAVKGIFSVKCSFSPTSNFRITNGIGGAGKGFVEPTIFAHTRLGGLVFADPDTHLTLARQAEQKKDAVVLSMRAIAEHADAHPECTVKMRIPQNSGRGRLDPATEYAKGLLTRGHYPNLARVFTEVAQRGTARTVTEEIRDLRVMRDDGLLTQAQFERAVDQLLGNS